MRTRNVNRIFYMALVCVVGLALATTAFGQGRGRGGGNSGGRGSGNGGGPPAGVGVDRGLGNASTRSNGRSDDGLSNASTRSEGRSDAGLERARTASNNLRNADRDLREHPGIANSLKVNANDLREGYQAALAVNPDLTFGNYVAATRLERNLSGRFPNVTRANILAGLADGDSLGRTLQNLGLNSDDAKAAKKQVEREMKAAKH